MKKKLLILVCLSLLSMETQCNKFGNAFAKIGTALSISGSRRIPDRFKPADTWAHPATLFHGSPENSIDILRPKPLGNRCKGQPIIFATHHIGLAATFMLKHKGKFACGRLPNGDIFYMTNDKRRCIAEDQGGTIYVVPSATFFCEAHVSLGVDEWISYSAIRPLAKFSFPSVLDAMLDFNVKIYFADNETYYRYWHLSSSEDEWVAFFKHLQPLTKKQLAEERAAFGIAIA